MGLKPKPVVKELGHVNELYGSEGDAERAKREAAALIVELRSKQTTVKGDLTPADVLAQGGPPEGIVMRGGPCDGLVGGISRGAKEFDRPVPNADPEGNQFVPAKYRRTNERTKDLLTVFKFVPAA